MTKDESAKLVVEQFKYLSTYEKVKQLEHYQDLLDHYNYYDDKENSEYVELLAYYLFKML